MIKLQTQAAKLWSFVKLYWSQILFGLAFVYIVLFVKNKTQMIENILAEKQQSEAAHAANINQLQIALQQEITKRQEIEKHFNDMLESIKKTNDQALENLANEREQDIKDVMVLYHNDPTAMATAVSTTFNIPIVHFPSVTPQ